MKIVLVRHLAPSVEPGTCYGRLDVPQSEAAAEQMAALISHPALSGAARVWSSPARRCRVLAEAIAARIPASPRIDPRLSELDFGDWEGRKWGTIEREALDLWAASPLTFAAPGGETGAALVRRVRAFSDALCRDPRDCVIVSHGGPLKVLAALLEGRPVDLFAPAPALGSIRIVARSRCD